MRQLDLASRDWFNVGGDTASSPRGPAWALEEKTEFPVKKYRLGILRVLFHSEAAVDNHTLMYMDGITEFYNSFEYLILLFLKYIFGNVIFVLCFQLRLLLVFCFVFILYEASTFRVDMAIKVKWDQSQNTT